MENRTDAPPALKTERPLTVELADHAPVMPASSSAAGWVMAGLVIAGAVGAVMLAKPAASATASMAQASQASIVAPAKVASEDSAEPVIATFASKPALNAEYSAPVGGGEAAAPALAKAPATEPAVITEDMLPLNELLHLAHASLRTGDLNRAEKRFRLAANKDPGNAEANAGLGQIARKEGDLVAAKNYFQASVDKSPLFVPGLMGLADVKWDAGEWTDAQARYSTVVEKLGDKAPPRARERLGASHLTGR